MLLLQLCSFLSYKQLFHNEKNDNTTFFRFRPPSPYGTDGNFSTVEKSFSSFQVQALEDLQRRWRSPFYGALQSAAVTFYGSFKIYLYICISPVYLRFLLLREPLSLFIYGELSRRRNSPVNGWPGIGTFQGREHNLWA